jgi:hypothetical protein
MNQIAIAAMAAIALLFQFGSHSNEVHNLQNRIDYLERELGQTERTLESYRSGVIEGQLN